MIRFPNCKINLGLHILEKLPDGYHRLETVFYPIGLSDILEILPAKEPDTSLNVTGIELPGKQDDNLCYKAWELFHKDFGIPAVKMHLHKIVPSGAGLGGGSSDAAAALNILNEIFHLGLTNDRLAVSASRLGMDCPFFLYNQPALGTGKGEQLQPCPVPLKGVNLLLVKPGFHVSTAEAYSGVTPRERSTSLAELVSLPFERWRQVLNNDFEDSVFLEYPEIGTIKDTLYQMGAFYASMSGSGSAVFGLFREKPAIPVSLQNFFIWQEELES